jgi:predicted dehydrogenase
MAHHPTDAVLPQKSQPVRAAVIGVGYLGQYHAEKYAKLANAQLVAVVDSKLERAQEIGQRLAVPHFADFRAVLKQVDAVSICVPTPFHYRIAGACLEAGVDVLVEKPMTVTLKEADDLITLAQQRGRVLQVGHLKRFHPAVVALRESGVLKHPRFIESHRLAPIKSRALDVDVVLDLMIHDLDLILNFVQSDVTQVQAVGAPVITDQIDMANARIQFASGCVANVTASRIARDTVRRIRIFQSDAFISLDFPSKNIQITRKTGGTMNLDGVELPALSTETLPIQDYDTLEQEIRAFCDAVRQRTDPAVSGRDGRRALEMVHRVKDSIDQFLRATAAHQPRAYP